MPVVVRGKAVKDLFIDSAYRLRYQSYNPNAGLLSTMITHLRLQAQGDTLIPC
jgi:hypothetical protein